MTHSRMGPKAPPSPPKRRLRDSWDTQSVLVVVFVVCGLLIPLWPPALFVGIAAAILTAWVD